MYKNNILLLVLLTFFGLKSYSYDFVVDGVYYNILSDNQVEITYRVYGNDHHTYSGLLKIPESVGYNGIVYNVTSIGDIAFYNCNVTGNIVIPNTVTSIGNLTFYNCSGLTGSLTIPNSVKTIKYGAFMGCSGLTGPLTIPNSVTSIESCAFYGCSGLSGLLTIPNTVTVIDNESFYGCSGFTGSLIIPSSVTVIESNAFEECLGLEELTIPNSVTAIREKAFYNCKNMSQVNSEIINPFNIWNDVFQGISSNAILKVPKGTKSRYEEYSGWTKYFKEIIENGSNTYTLKISASGNGWVNATYGSPMQMISVRGETSTSIVTETYFNLKFSPDVGYKLKSLKVNGSDVTSLVLKDNSYPLTINGDTSIEVEFEAISTYTLSITSTGNGSVLFNGTTVRGKTSSFTVEEEISATITFAPDNGYRIKSVKVNSTDVTSKVSNNSYTISNISSDTSMEVEFEAIPPTTYSLSIKATGNGTATYDGTSVRGKTSSFTVTKGTSATIAFAPDNGYRIKSVKVNNTDATTKVTNNTYTISNISSDTSVEVVFEANPTYTLAITSTGNGSASYNGTTIRGKTSSFTVYEGTSATVSFTPDSGYRIASVKENSKDVTANVTNNRYTINSITANTKLEVTFEEIPPTTYSLSITATGNGSVTYNNVTLINKTQTFTVNEGEYATISISPESGYRIKSVMLNSTDVTANVKDNQYTTSKITSNTTMKVTFEAIPITTYTLTIKATGNGSASYDGTSVREKTSTFTVNEGTSISIAFSPDNGNSISSVKVDGNDVTSEVSGNRYVIENVTTNVSVEVTFIEDVNALTVEGVNFKVTSQSDKTIIVVGGDFGQVLTVPAEVTQNGTTWVVTGIDNDALKNHIELAAIIWNPEVAFTATVNNPNLLLYVKAEEYNLSGIKNVIVNGTASNITLVDDASGNSFYCPQAFTAQKISYTHTYSMTTGVGETKGWETITLPFDVQTVKHISKGTIVPFAKWKQGDIEKPFWLYELTGDGFKPAESINAYTPYIISMPNNPQYDTQWLLNGEVTFTSNSVTIGETKDVKTASYMDRIFTPCFTDKAGNEGLYALNALNDYSRSNGGSPEGSRFILNLRNIHPFEAYMTTVSGARFAIDIFEDMTTTIETIESIPSKSGKTIYDLQGRKINTPSKKGVYIINGKKQIIK